jgi:transcriptional regulator with XRE-family HTH domain
MFDDATCLTEFFERQDNEPGDVRAALGPRIRRARLRRLHGRNLETFGRQIAELMGRRRAFSNVTISNWETGRQEPSFEALVAIARLTQLPLRYFAGIGEMEDYPAIDWLAPPCETQADRLRDALLRARSLPTRAQELILAQLKSLIDDLYRLNLTNGRA